MRGSYNRLVKRRLTKLVLFLLLLGAIINVGVAWGIWVCGDRPEINPFGGWMNGGRMWIEHGGTGIRPRSQRTTTFTYLAHGEYTATLSAFGMRFRDTVTYASVAPKSGVHAWSCVAECGWPLMCLTLRESKTIPGVGKGRQGALQIGGVVVPSHPLWPGLAINTIFYAAILWLLTLGPLTARRMIRRKRGHCIKCGYDLRGEFSAGCSECGWRREEPHG